MKEINRHLAEIDEKLLHLKVSLDQADHRSCALELVVSWLLARQPEDEAFRFLASQANELENAPDKNRHLEAVALLDDLRAQVSDWRAQWQDIHKDQR